MELSEKLAVAWRRMKHDRSTDFIIGDFEYLAYDRFRDRLLEALVDRIVEEGADYQPKPLRVIRVPKASYTTRPGSVPEIEDRILYQSLVDDLAEGVERNLSPIEDGVLHSYRYAGNREAAEMFRFGDASYATFSQRTREISEAYPFVVVTDIASFYERIYHHELDNTLRGLGGDTNAVQRVMTLLRKWRKGSSYGIPQGIWPSDYLGNIYLDPVDKFVARLGYELCRYVDDIRVGADSYLGAQRILLALEERLAPLGLALSAAKTSIVPSDEVEEVLFPYKPRFDEIFVEVREALSDVLPLFDPYAEIDPNQISELEARIEITSARQLFREELEKLQPNPSVGRFCLSTFRTFSDLDIVDDVLDNLDKLVEVSPRVVAYLGHMAKSEPDLAADVRGRVAAFVGEEGATVYDWHQMWLLQCLERIGDLESGTVGDVRSLLMNRRHLLHDAVVVQALLLVGRHGDDADRTWLMQLYDETHSPWVKRAILFAVRHLDKAKRNHFYGYCRGEDHLTDAVIDYAISET